MQPKISVVIPVYNISVYLEKCLWSVTNQTFKELEIIIINDGSTDNSPSVIEKYANTDKRITVINQPNQGLSSAREVGLAACNADYIHFLDGDDFIELNCYEVLYGKAIAEDADVVTMKFWEQKGEQLTESRSYGKSKLDGLSLLTQILEVSMYYTVWQYIHKRSLHANGIKVDKRLTIGEDAYLTTQILYYAKKVIVTDIPLYHYIVRDTSIMGQQMTDKNAASTLLYPYLIHDFMRDKPEYEQIKNAIHCTETISITVLLRAHYLKGYSAQCRNVMTIRKTYPKLYEVSGTNYARKMIIMFAINPLLGRLYAQYCIWRKRI